MDFDQLVQQTSKKCGMEKQAVKRTLKASFEILREEVTKKNNVHIEGLGAFAHRPDKDPEKPLRTIFTPARRQSHRSFVGGLWDSMGALQFEFLRDWGMIPASRLLDIGCGSLRAGVRIVEYLDAGNYFGTDIRNDLLDAGYDIELAKLNLQEKVPRENLVCDGEFQFSRFGATFDFALAQSLFTHLPADKLRACLANLAPRMRPGGNLFVTFFLVPEDHPVGTPFEHPHGITSVDDENPFHYRPQTIRECAEGLPWDVTIVGDWNHPRDQQMVAFTRR